MSTRHAVARECLARRDARPHRSRSGAGWMLGLVICLLGCDSYTPSQKRSGIYEGCCEGVGTCVPGSAVPEGDRANVGQDICEEKLLCVPMGLAEKPTEYLFDTCRSFGLAEGRCLPTCLPAVTEQADRLQQDGCPDASLCVPCSDPLTGDNTGACLLGGDRGPTEPATFFAFCCGEKGRCIPQAIVGDDMSSSLAIDTCDTATHSVCVPQVWVDDRTAQSPTCQSWDNAEGRCLSVCLPEVARRADQLRSDTCDEDYRCVPCFDPITGDPTTACTLGEDKPQSRPQKFASCCGDVGSCVPTEAIAAKDRAQLGVDTCSEADRLCVPREWAALDAGRPQDCSAYGGAAGRCLPTCLPEVAAQQDRLQRDSCDDVHLCVPCYDPITGENTGACTVLDDQPPTQAYLFDNCCKDRGRCVPQGAVPEAQRGNLGPETCTEGSDALCVPNQWLDGATAVPAKCVPYGDYEGRCLPECLPAVADKLGRLKQTTCQTGEVCAPCWDPLTGAATGACDINGDVPGPVRTFANCCGEIGACVPSDALTSDDQKRLDAGECAAVGGGLCAPEAWVVDARAAPNKCRTYGGDAEGRCLPGCLPDVRARADRLLQETCAAAELCVPCFDPITLASTRACNIGPDAAEERPAGFGECCGQLGWCVPQALVKDADRARLPVDACDAAAGQICAPSDWVKDDRFTPVTCDTPGGYEGRCLPECMPDVAARKANLTQTTCASAHLCVPCFDPVSGEDTGSCTINGDKPKNTQMTTYPDCCGGGGLCVPNELIDEGDRSRLGADACNAAALCVPRAWTAAKRPAPSTCRAADNAEGRCLPSCLPDVGAQSKNLKQATCGADDLCVPCFDPLDGHDTGACTTQGDAPKEPAVIFPMCCGALGRCVPTELVSSEDRGDLGADSCTAADHLCAPNNSLGANAAPAATCHESKLSGEGRCLPNCLPSVAEKLGDLEQGSCAASTSCVPCYDPISGEDTGACTQGSDKPKEAKKVFEQCCSGAARCVSSSLVDAAERDKLDKRNCTTPADALCVPTEWVSNEPAPPKSCRAPGDVEARCLLNCLPSVESRKDKLRQQSCGSAELCVPCYDPLTGEDTGSCKINGDAPKEGKKTYPDCCGSHGTCVPKELVDNAGSLKQDSCSGGSVCAPQDAARGNKVSWSGCTVLFIANGACVPKCFISGDQDTSLLSSDGCGGDELCAPCNQVSVNNSACN